ncbi:MAG: Gfo/Idh/MocA family oxidoreductase [Lentisphaerae bacterium]|nr:Gfo/Idh/MocA family oxidoreductase [Lentisphaerota bacterium]
MENLRLGIIGCGWVRPAHMSGIFDETPDIEVVAACDPHPPALAAFSSRYRVPHAYADPAQLLAHPGLDAVSIAVKPEPEKVRLAIRALERGLHVLAEKPMALTIPEAESMAAAARRSGRVLQIGFNRRFEPVYQAAHALLHDRDTFGTLVTCHASYAGAQNEFPYVTFMAQNPHTFDGLQYLAGPVRCIRSVVHRQMNPARFDSIQDKLGHPSEREYNRTEPGLVGISVASTLSFASGAVGTFALSTAAPAGRLTGDRAEFLGTRGTALVIEGMDRAVIIRPGGAEDILSSSSWSRKASSFGLEYRHFVEWIRTGRPTRITLADGLRSVYLYDAFLRSLRTDAPCDVPQVTEAAS